MAERSRHRLPFGAEPGPASVRFRIWAPDCTELRLTSAAAELPMQRNQQGWFEVVTDALKPGDGYSYRLPDGLEVPDPAARAQAGDVHGASVVVDPEAYQWQHHAWSGRPWETAVIAEVHVGTVTPEGTFAGLRRRLDHYAAAGITAVELMPLAQFSGRRGWGYDGVLLYAPHNAYGTPDDLKRLVDAAHGLGLMMLLDVVYNHFGPDGNYLPRYASAFFDRSRSTPWGAGIDFGTAQVRDFYVHNALYWLEEFRFDGLRLDAVDQIEDHSETHILSEIAERIHGRFPGRHVHLVLENDRNEAHRLVRGRGAKPRFYTAQWNDDFHHAAHVALTGETDGYYADYADPVLALARALAEGFVYQGGTSDYRGGRPRGEPSGHLPPTAFVAFIQNHDQVGNRALGERLTVLADERALAAALALVLLCPSVPLLFQGEEWGETRPFLFFCDFHGALADAVREGRRAEFSRFMRFASPESRELIPDPNAKATFDASKLDWKGRRAPCCRRRLETVRRLLAIRRSEIVPLLTGVQGQSGEIEFADAPVLGVCWRLRGGVRLFCRANLSATEARSPAEPSGRVLWPGAPRKKPGPSLAPWTVIYTLEPGP